MMIQSEIEAMESLLADAVAVALEKLGSDVLRREDWGVRRVDRSTVQVQMKFEGIEASEYFSVKVSRNHPN